MLGTAVVSIHLREAVRSNMINMTKTFFNKSLFLFPSRKISSDASSKAIHKKMHHLQYFLLSLDALFNFLFLSSCTFTVYEMLTSLLKLNRRKAVKGFKSSVGPRCTLMNLARAGKKSPLPTVCPSPLEEVRSLPPIGLNRTDHANVPYQCQQKARDAPFCHYRR